MLYYAADFKTPKIDFGDILHNIFTFTIPIPVFIVVLFVLVVLRMAKK